MDKYAESISLGIPNDKLKWIGVDLDGTLAQFIWPKPGIGEPMPGAVEAMQKIHESGDKIIIYTSRSWGEYCAIEDWCNDHKIPFSRISCGKPLFKYVIDDKNVEFHGNWEETLDKIK